MTVGFYSPLPPARTAWRIIRAALLAELRRHGRVEVAPARCDAALYHLGNNGLHAEIYRRAIAAARAWWCCTMRCCNHFFLGQLNEAAYVDEFVYNYGEWNRALARELWRGARGVGGRRAVLSLSHAEAHRRNVRGPWWCTIRRPRAVVREHARRRAGGGDSAPVRASAIARRSGSPALPRFAGRTAGDLSVRRVRIFARVQAGGRVLERSPGCTREMPQAGLLIAGQFVSSDLERAVAPLLDAPGVWRLPYLAEREFWLAARAVDACINLRYPAAGESSGITVRMMGIGKPVLLSEGQESVALSGRRLRPHRRPGWPNAIRYGII